MAGRATNNDAHAIARGVGSAAYCSELADRDLRMVVKAECEIHAGKRPVLDHRGSTAEYLLGRLEQQADAAGQIRRQARKDAGHSEQR